MACGKFVALNDGTKMPLVGIGTWNAPDAEIETALDTALTYGYRHIDTAPVYFNEKAIGRVLKKWLDTGKIKREELYVVTKLPCHAVRPDLVEKTLRKSLEDLQLSCIDMYLIHAPVTFIEGDGMWKRDEDGNMLLDVTTDLVAVWKKMEEMVAMRLTKSIGISNFNKNQIQRIIDNSKIKPANLQVEINLYFQQHELVDFCQSKNIAVTAYSPLGSIGVVKTRQATGIWADKKNILEDPLVLKLAEKYKKGPGQIALRWLTQRNICIIPKSTNPERLKQNINLFDFELTKDEMTELSKIDKGIRVCDFTSFKGIEKHPECPWEIKY